MSYFSPVLKLIPSSNKPLLLYFDSVAWKDFQNVEHISFLWETEHEFISSCFSLMVSSLYVDDTQFWVVLGRAVSGSALSTQHTAPPGTDMQPKFVDWPFLWVRLRRWRDRGESLQQPRNEWLQVLWPLLNESAPQTLWVCEQRHQEREFQLMRTCGWLAKKCCPNTLHCQQES